MNQIEIYFMDNSELSEFEANEKGYRLDVYVRIDDKLYNLKIYDMIRLKQDFYDEIEQQSYYSIESNLIIVKQVSKKEICITIEGLFKERYFDDLKPVSDFDISRLVKIN
ncbi:hypothetical protein [Clostridium manihotivorum]|uniref:Uncharacterized protein n=1 Tax=Clostridium manihotivorum TaxID=2320868 RepID=A0A3R5TGT1_9CLOT|nr:hypothetical protein [Clostridium manihotivorum]QAA33126.1 hypothetical protein C1I91_16610 [Clostridium manihotivorum]